MKIAIFCDMEGISGISCNLFVGLKEPCYHLGQKYMTADANACIRGCFNGGADEVMVYDGHCAGTNILWSELDPRAELVQGVGGEERYPYLKDFDALILLGYHTKAGALNGVLHHTYSSAAIQNIWLNGKTVGEFGLDAAIAADYDVPVIMTSGCDLLCKEALEWVPDVITCEVKKSIGQEKARLLPMEKAHKKIEEYAGQAVRSAGNIKPVKIEKPVILTLENRERVALPRLSSRPGVRRLNERTIEVTGDTVESALWQLL